jgi:hypothetical protein
MKGMGKVAKGKPFRKKKICSIMFSKFYVDGA